MAAAKEVHVYEEMLTEAHIDNLRREREGERWTRAWSRMMDRCNELRRVRAAGRSTHGSAPVGGSPVQQ